MLNSTPSVVMLDIQENIRAELKMHVEPKNKLELPELGYKTMTFVMQHVSPAFQDPYTEEETGLKTLAAYNTLGSAGFDFEMRVFNLGNEDRLLLHPEYIFFSSVLDFSEGKSGHRNPKRAVLGNRRQELGAEPSMSMDLLHNGDII
ncbi:hypothetical protein llap_1229 [Limosa lapponica baueri]|uniref:Uncharacterized protein n=1 Tax=Limosa lapponica baueri TaxID=1758121 RepID=A0A2I0UR14_LIMLA|nr:hypothetical protein llap_1229 [Limosa lapponica baueri]